MSKMTVTADAKPMLNAYPDSVGGTLSDITGFLQKPELKDVFSSFYILPSVFNTDLDRGFSVIDYTLNEELADKKDLEALEELGINLKLDFILNHASVLSRQFQDILINGDDSKYRDFFIDWNKFWEGTMTEEGYIQPDQELIEHMFFRKPGLPILMVRFPDGKNVPYWNTFYQEIKYPVLDAQDIMQPDGDRPDPGIGCPGKHGSNKLRGTVKTDPAKLWQGNMMGIFKPHVAGQLFFAVQIIVGIRLIRLFTAFLLKSRHAPVLLLLVLPCRAVVLDGIGDRLFINFFPIQERQCILDPVHRMGNSIQVIDPFPVDRDHPCSFAQPVTFVPAGDQMVINSTFCPVIDSDQMFLQV